MSCDHAKAAGVDFCSECEIKLAQTGAQVLPRAEIKPIGQDGAHLTLIPSPGTPARAASERNVVFHTPEGCSGFVERCEKVTPETHRRISGHLQSIDTGGARFTSPTFRPGRGCPSHYTDYTPGGTHERMHNFVPCGSGNHHTVRTHTRLRRCSKQPASASTQKQEKSRLTGCPDEIKDKVVILKRLMQVAGYKKSEHEQREEYNQFVIKGLNSGSAEDKLTREYFEKYRSLYQPRELFSLDSSSSDDESATSSSSSKPRNS